MNPRLSLSLMLDEKKASLKRFNCFALFLSVLINVSQWGPLPSTAGVGTVPAAAAVCCLGNRCWEAVLYPAPGSFKTHNGRQLFSVFVLDFISSGHSHARVFGSVGLFLKAVKETFTGERKQKEGKNLKWEQRRDDVHHFWSESSSLLSQWVWEWSVIILM